MRPTLFLTALAMTPILIILFTPIALKLGLTDHPCHRKQHKQVTPLIGGLIGYITLGYALNHAGLFS